MFIYTYIYIYIVCVCLFMYVYIYVHITYLAWPGFRDFPWSSLPPGPFPLALGPSIFPWSPAGPSGTSLREKAGSHAPYVTQ